MDFLRTYCGEVASAIFAIMISCAFFVIFERLFPRRGTVVSTGSRAKAVLFWSVNAAIMTLIAYGVRALWQPLGVKPLLPALDAGLPAPLGLIVATVAAAFVGDFFYYWCHRAQHRFFWRFHAVHHSVREMSGITAYHHFTEGLFEFALYVGPLSLLVGGAHAIPIVGGLLAWQGNYEHSPVRLHFGALGRYFVDNRFHRIHHSVEPRHFDKNFCIFTTLWDSVFGTAYFPQADEWPRTGVAEMPEPTSVMEFLTAPFRWRRPEAIAVEAPRIAPEFATEP